MPLNLTNTSINVYYRNNGNVTVSKCGKSYNIPKIYIFNETREAIQNIKSYNSYADLDLRFGNRDICRLTEMIDKSLLRTHKQLVVVDLILYLALRDTRIREALIPLNYGDEVSTEYQHYESITANDARQFSAHHAIKREHYLRQMIDRCYHFQSAEWTQSSSVHEHLIEYPARVLALLAQMEREAMEIYGYRVYSFPSYKIPYRLAKIDDVDTSYHDAMKKVLSRKARP